MLAHLIQMVKDGRVKTEDGQATDRFDLPPLGERTTMDLKLTGKTVLITGGSRGIGFACAEAFAAEGCAVHIASRSKESLEGRARQDPRPPQRAGRDPCRRLLQGRHGAQRRRGGRPRRHPGEQCRRHPARRHLRHDRAQVARGVGAEDVRLRQRHARHAGEDVRAQEGRRWSTSSVWPARASITTMSPAPRPTQA